MAIEEIMSEYVKKDKLNFKSLKLSKRKLQHIRRIVFVGTGAGYSSALYGASVFERLTDVLVSAYPAGEFRYSPTVVDSNTLLIAVSQSGDEENILASIKRIRAIGGRVIAICPDAESAVSKAANTVITPIEASFEDECFVLSLLALYVGRKYGFVTQLYQSVTLRMAETLSGKINSVERFNPQLDEARQWIEDEGNVVICGRGTDYAVAVNACKSLNASPCYISQLANTNLENKKILAVVSSKDFLNDVMFYLDLAKQKGESVLVLTTDDVAEAMPKMSGVVALSGTLPVFNPIVIASAIHNIS